MRGNGTLYEEVVWLRRENTRLYERARWYRRSRDHWRAEAEQWKWGALHGGSKVSTRSTDLSPTERAERSGVV